MSNPKYIAEFDTLRALAAFGVMATHYGLLGFVPVVGALEKRLGAVGVDMFFALSGFLITGILLRCKELHPEQKMATTLRQFFARRFLRIFPLYYLVFAIFAFWFTPELQNRMWWFLTYTVNFGKHALGLGGWSPLNHFWTLAVEEQFYIAWPFIVLLASKKSLVRICLVGSILSLATRVLIEGMDMGSVAISQFTPCCLEPLLLGAAFAAGVWTRPRKQLWQLLAGSAAASLWMFLFASNEMLAVLARSFYGVCFASLIYVIAINSGHRFMSVLRIPPILFLGQISYGLYVWHLPVRWIWQESDNEIPIPDWMPENTERVAESLAMISITILVATVSWIVFERPVNSLKRHFPYRLKGKSIAKVE